MSQALTPWYLVNPPMATKRPLFDRLRSFVDTDTNWLLLWLCVWVCSNGADVIWIYFYIYACIHPNPRIAINISNRGFHVYEGFMYTLGAFVACVNLITYAMYADTYRRGHWTSNIWKSSAFRSLHVIVVTSIMVMFVAGPILSPYVALRITQKIAWDTGCNDSPIQIVLSGRSYWDPSYYTSTAQYYQGSSPAYTYDIFQSSADEWFFNLRTLDNDDLNPFALEYPLISNITYNFVTYSVSGTCTSPSSNSTLPCIEGSFNPGNYLSFDFRDLRTNTSTTLQSVDKEWTFTDDAPSVLLKNTSGTEVIWTDVTKPGKFGCTYLKVCAGQDAGPQIIVPIGLILIRQMDYAIECTTPKPKDDDDDDDDD